MYFKYRNKRKFVIYVYVQVYNISVHEHKKMYNKLHSFRDIYLMQTLFFKQKKTWRVRPEKKTNPRSLLYILRVK